MKKIVLLGDSIRMGYDKYVKEALSDVAEVYYPDENCRFAANLLRFVHDWKRKGSWPDDVDLVHWNAGAWDVLKMFGEDTLSTPEYYKLCIERIDRRLRLLFPKAKMVFATTANGVDEGYGSRIFRTNADIRRFNDIALGVLKPLGVEINDIYALTDGCKESCRSDMTHFNTDDGRALLGGRVVSVICNALGIDAKDVKIENFKPEDYSAENIGY